MPKKRLSSTKRRILGFLGAFCLMGLAFAGFGAQPVLAHNSLVTSVPTNGAVLTEAPTTLSLMFSKDVALNTASAEVVAADGVRTALAAPTHGVTPKEILFSLPTALSGSVGGRWRLVGTDGHVITERLSFTVSVAVPDTTGAGAGSPDITNTTVAVDHSAMAMAPIETEIALTPESVRLAIRWLGFAALILVGGMLFTELWFARGVLRAPRAREASLIGGGVLGLAPLLQTLIFLDDSRDFGVFRSLLHIFEAFDTTAGAMLFVRFLAGGVIFAGILRATRHDTGLLVARPMLVSAGVYLISLAYAGHSRSMKWPVLGVPADVVHTTGAAVWLGGLVVFVFFVIPTLQPSESFDAFRRFGHAAHYAVIAVVVTGVIHALRLHGSIITLFTQNHGRWLLLKLVLVASMLKIGDINRRRLMRKLPVDEADFAGRVALLRRASITEIVNGALVMLVTAVLVASSFN